MCKRQQQLSFPENTPAIQNMDSSGLQKALEDMKV
jgi:hypothetical protein